MWLLWMDDMPINMTWVKFIGNFWIFDSTSLPYTHTHTNTANTKINAWELYELFFDRHHVHMIPFVFGYYGSYIWKLESIVKYTHKKFTDIQFQLNNSRCWLDSTWLGFNIWLQVTGVFDCKCPMISCRTKESPILYPSLGSAAAAAAAFIITTLIQLTIDTKLAGIRSP